MEVDITELDTIYLSYDEEQADRFWAIIKTEIPWAKRVHGVKGSDAAHKACAELSTTDRFILIDGDNLPDWRFFNLTLRLTPNNANNVFRWRAINSINNLSYGNGGLSSWTREFARTMKTHESSDGDDKTAIEFCYNPDYWAMYDCYSTTYPDASPKQAWRAGFREGVKLSLDQGSRIPKSEFTTRVEAGNMRHLRTWASVGRDVENGIWAILGARMGINRAMLTDWDISNVQDFDYLNDMWEDSVSKYDPEYEARELLEDINWMLELDIPEMEADVSRLFKSLQTPRKNLDIMLREGEEIAVFRKGMRSE